VPHRNILLRVHRIEPPRTVADGRHRRARIVKR
jgi:hypothetical protein